MTRRTTASCMYSALSFAGPRLTLSYLLPWVKRQSLGKATGGIWNAIWVAQSAVQVGAFEGCNEKSRILLFTACCSIGVIRLLSLMSWPVSADLPCRIHYGVKDLQARFIGLKWGLIGAFDAFRKPCMYRKPAACLGTTN